MIRDIRHAVRSILRMPGLATVVVLSLGIGIGVNTAVFTWIQSRLWQPLPAVPQSGRVLSIEPRADNGGYPGLSWREFRDLRERLPSFEDILAFRPSPFNVGSGDEIERRSGLFVSDNYFAALGVTPALGRFPDPDVGDVPREAVVVISYDYWLSRFGGEPGAIGQTMRLNDRPVAVIGVTPRGFQGTVLGLTFDMWVPARLVPVLLDGSRELESRRVRAYAGMGRLRHSATRAQAQGDLDAAMRQLAQEYPETNGAVRGEVLASWESPRGPQRFITAALAVLQAVMLLVLLVVCGNTANLLLARASTRRREVSIRLALGAGRRRIVSLMLCETVLLALAGAALGAVIAVWGTNALRAVPMPTPGGMAVRFQTSVDAVSVAFAALLGLAAGVLIGLPPALQLSRVQAPTSLRTGATTAERRLMRDVLMSLEVALALVVLVVAALFIKSFNDTRAIDPGFRRDGVMLAVYDLRSRSRIVEPSVSVDFAHRLLVSLRASPAIESAAIASALPLDIHGLPSRSFRVQGRVRADGALDRSLTNTVTPGYFRTMAIPFRAGADFVPLDDTVTAPEAIVNEEFVRRYLESDVIAEAIGRALEVDGRRHVIAGVTRNTLLNAFGEPPTPMLYLSYRDRPMSSGEIHVRTRAGSAIDRVADIRRSVGGIDRTLAIYNLRTMNDHVDTNLIFRRIPARMFVVIGPLLLGLAAIGIYAVVVYAVAQRRVEIGMRLALGATSRQVVTGLVGETLRVVGLGMAGGWLVALMIDRDAVRNGTANWAILLGVPAVLLLVAAAACWLPARRASRLDPTVALRQE